MYKLWELSTILFVVVFGTAIMFDVARNLYGEKVPYYKEINRWAIRYGVPTPVMLALFETESNFNPLAHNPADPGTGSYGLGQLQLGTARDMLDTELQKYFNVAGITSDILLDNPELNIALATKYFSRGKPANPLTRRYRYITGRSNHVYDPSTTTYNTGVLNDIARFTANLNKFSKLG